MLTVLEYPAPCRWCGERSFLADDSGPVHPCCEQYATADCPACAASRAHARQWEQYGKKHARQVKAYWDSQAAPDLPDPAGLPSRVEAT